MNVLYSFNRLLRKIDYHEVIDCLVTALEARDVYTSGHSGRVADMTSDLGKKLGLSSLKLEDIHLAAHLHDIGKLGVSEHVLNKKGILQPHEIAQLQQHPEIGYRILSKSKGLQEIARIVLHHHERWDGNGYPAGLKLTNIPLGSRIIALSDSVDAMVSDRPYRQAFTWEKCWEEVLANKGKQFDPVIVEAAEKLWPEWEQKKKLKRSMNIIAC